MIVFISVPDWYIRSAVAFATDHTVVILPEHHPLLLAGGVIFMPDFSAILRAMSKDDQQLIKSLESLKEAIDTTNSWKRTLLLGVVRGIGAVIGASIVAGLLLGWAATTFDSFSNVPLIGPFFSEVSETLESSTE